MADRRELERVASLSPYTCPECGGVLFRLKDERLMRFRCVQAHAWSPLSLLSALVGASEQALFAATRSINEEIEISREIAHKLPSQADRPALLAHSITLAQQVRELQSFLAANGMGD